VSVHILPVIAITPTLGKSIATTELVPAANNMCIAASKPPPTPATFPSGSSAPCAALGATIPKDAVVSARSGRKLHGLLSFEHTDKCGRVLVEIKKKMSLSTLDPVISRFGAAHTDGNHEFGAVRELGKAHTVSIAKVSRERRSFSLPHLTSVLLR
jgi:hypothetical protein